MKPVQSSERGAILIFVALTLAVLMGLAAFAFDTGVFWMARGQAQNAADAGALAGALSLQFDDAADLTSTGPAYKAAVAVAGQNGVSGGTAGVHVDLAADLTTWEHSAPASCAAGGCVQVDVFRDGSHGSTGLPTFFAKIFGVTSQAMKATATAQVLVANTSTCLAPYFLIDRYIDGGATGYTGNPPDSYIAPGLPGATGYLATDIGTTVDFHVDLSPSGYGQLDVGSGTDAIRDALNSCWTSPLSLSPPSTMATDPGNKVGQKKGLDALWDSDPMAVWNPSTQTIDNSCAPSSCSCPASPTGICKYGGAISPRIMQVMICAPTELACAEGGGGGSGKTITPTNILSFFYLGYTNDKGNLTIHAVIIGSPGSGSGAGVPGGASFLTVVNLVR